MLIQIDRDRCCGAGHCVRRAPDVFDHDDDGVVVLRRAPASQEAARDAEDAAAHCPTGAITLLEPMEVGRVRR